MVGEMRRARSAAVLPRLAIGIRPIVGGFGYLRLSNVGSGPALTVNVTMNIEPGGPVIHWEGHVLVPGEAHEFIPRAEDKTLDLFRLNALVDRFDHISLHATYKDALGELHKVDDRIEIREWWRALETAHQIVGHDYPQEATNELKKIREVGQRLTTAVEKLSAEEDNSWKWESRVRRLPARWQPAARRVLRRFDLL
jgi:hypothetical protein